MKKLIIITALLFLIFVGIGSFFISLAKDGEQLDSQSKQFVDAVVPKIISQWDISELIDNMDQESLTPLKRQQLEWYFSFYSKLGKMKSYKGSKAEATTSVFNGAKEISAEYAAEADFETGKAVVNISINKKAGHWKIVAFKVNSISIYCPIYTNELKKNEPKK